MSKYKEIWFLDIEEKRKELLNFGIENSFISDEIVDKIVVISDESPIPLVEHMNDGSKYIKHFHTSIWQLSNIKNEYILIKSSNEEYNTITCNLLEYEYLSSYFPEIYKIINRDEIINKIID